MYWEDEFKVVQTQDPDTIREIIRDGVNIYPLLSLDIQLINCFRRNTMCTILEKLHFYPSMSTIYAAGAPDPSECPVPTNFKDFEMFLAKLKQNRWESIKFLSDSENKKRDMLKGINDTLTDAELFSLSKSLSNEMFNIEYANLALARESNFISLFKPAALKLPAVRVHLTETWAEKEFIQSCKPIDSCIASQVRPYWKDGLDFQNRQEHVIYKLAEKEAQFYWKKDRQDDKDLNIRLPVGIDYLEWRDKQERLKRNDIKLNYQQFLSKMEGLTNKIEIDDIEMALKIQDEEKRMKTEIQRLAKRLWLLQKEKKTVADGQIFTLEMINERCLPIINGLLDKPRPAPKFKVKILEKPMQLAITAPNNKEDKPKDEWNESWSE